MTSENQAGRLVIVFTPFIDMSHNITSQILAGACNGANPKPLAKKTNYKGLDGMHVPVKSPILIYGGIIYSYMQVAKEAGCC